MMTLFTLAAAFLLLMATASADIISGCDTVKIDGPSNMQTSRIGAKYSMISTLNYGRPVFKNTDRTDYLYYTEYDYAWNVGPRVNGSRVGLYVYDNSTHPADVTRSWLVLYGTSFYYQTEVEVICVSKDIPVWSIALSALGGIGVLLVAAGIMCHCINKKKQRVHGASRAAARPARRLPCPRQPPVVQYFNGGQDLVHTYGLPPSYSVPQGKQIVPPPLYTADPPPAYSMSSSPLTASLGVTGAAVNAAYVSTESTGTLPTDPPPMFTERDINPQT